MRFRSFTAFMVPLAAALLLTACGGTPVGPATSIPTVPTNVQDMATADPSRIADEAEAMADEIVEDLEEEQALEGGGSATFTAGDRTWEFASVLCAFGEEAIGQKDAEFVLAAMQDGFQLYLSIDSFGHHMSLDDISDFENPSVSLSDDSSDGDFLIVDGKNVRGESTVYDTEDLAMTRMPGVVEATCP